MNVANKNQMEEIYRFDHLYKLGFLIKFQFMIHSHKGRWATTVGDTGLVLSF